MRKCYFRSSRRQVLLGLTAGIVGAFQLPATWTKPVIESVILPAHAQTTTCARPELLIPGRTFSCRSPTETISFDIIDMDICAPTYTTGTTNVEAANRITIYYESSTDAERVFVSGSAGEVASAVVSTGGVCPGTVIISGGAFSFQMQGSSGLLFEATGRITAAPASITVSTIQLVPV